MVRKSVSIEEALEKFDSIVKKFVASPPPNEEMPDIDYGKLQELALGISSKIDESTQDDLISNVNNFIEDLSIPEIEYMTASRGLIVTQAQGLALVRALQQIKISAQAAGYKDPDKSNLDISSIETAKHIKEVNIKLEELRGYVLQLDKQLKDERQVGVSVGIGPISADIGVISSAIKKTTEDAQEYITKSKHVNAKILQDKFEEVNSSAKSLIKVVAINSNVLGKKIINLSRKIAKAAADAYISSLNLVKSVFETQQNSDKGYDKNIEYKSISESMIDSDLQQSGGDYAHPAGRIIGNLLVSIAQRPSGHYLQSGKISRFETISSHGKKYAIIYIGDHSISFTCQISTREFETLSKIESSRLARITEKYRSLLPDFQ